MSEVKHTEGPWLATNEARRVSAPAKGFLTVATTCIGSSNSKDGLFRIGPVEAAANARLIAAAPDMFEALEAFNLKEEWIVSGSADSLTIRVPFAVIQQAAAAIARARGDQS